MKVAVIGLGSMGKRRIRLIRQYDADIDITGVDINLQRCEEAKKEYAVKACASLREAVDKYGVQAAFISTSPLSHAKIIEECLGFGLHVFTELNLVADGYDGNIKLAEEKGCTLFLSSTFLYRAETRHIIETARSAPGKLCYNYHIGQYLPDWHPWEHYKEFFISDKRTNGCREIFAIELPWIIEAFGKIAGYMVIKDKITALDVDYPDNYMVILRHEGGHKGVLCVDVVSRKAVRNLEVYGENLYMSWDGTPMGLAAYDFENKRSEAVLLYDKVDKLSGYSPNIIENAYYNEVACFFDAIAGKQTPRYTFEDDRAVLDLIGKLEGEL
jgi:predicted dehydrogenase